MLRLRTLAGLSVESDSHPLESVAAQRRRLALLAVIAAAGHQGVSRDKLLALLWPEAPADRARHALAQALYALRQALGRDDIVSGGPELRLNPEAIEADCILLRESLAAGDLVRAVALYTGPFLDGVHLADAPGFERWAEEERGRIAREARNALRELANRARAAGNGPARIAWLERLVALDPLDAPAVASLMNAHVAAGDRAAAVRCGRAYESAIRSELDADPAPEVAALLLELRGHPSPPSGIPAVGAAPRPARLTNDDDSGGEPDDARASPDAPARHTRAPVPSRFIIPWLIATGAAVLAAVAFTRRDDAAATNAARFQHVAILPFEVRSSPELAYLADGMVDLLAGTMDGIGEIRVVHPRALLGTNSGAASGARRPSGVELARRFGADYFVIGSVVSDGERVQLHASLHPTANPSRPRGTAVAEGPVDSLFVLSQELSTQLLSAHLGVGAEQRMRGAGRRARTPGALRAYLEGEAHLRGGRYVEAADAFARAVAADSTFAVAHYRLSIASDWAGRPVAAEEAASQAVRYSGDLGIRDRRMFAALQAWRRGETGEAEQLYRAAVSEYPYDVDALYQLGEVLFHDGPFLGQSAELAREPFERVTAIEPEHFEALRHLARLAALRRDWAAVDSLTELLLQHLPPTEGYEPRAFATLLTAGPDERAHAYREARLASELANDVLATRVAVYGGALDAADSIVRIAGEGRTAVSRAVRLTRRAMLAMARGDLGASAELLVSAHRAAPDGGALEYMGWRSALPFVPLDSVAARQLMAELARGGVRIATRTSYGEGVDSWAARRFFAGHLRLRLGDTAAARAIADSLESDTLVPPGSTIRQAARLGASLRARILLASGRPAEALRALPHGHRRMFAIAETLDRWTRAEAHVALGEREQAARWYSSFSAIGLEDLAIAPAADSARRSLGRPSGDGTRR